MPLYEYRCVDCEQVIEVIQKFSDSPLEICQSCGGQLVRLLSAPAIQFKGSGWYITDYAGKNGKASPTSGDSSSPSAAKAESKSAPAAGKTDSSGSN
ncbi:MAG: zinc ribbon domain-containing protein [Acidobacteria bacterium]|nr:zinc ribbon domain-containing protein [Acidobacteriota bacterium]